MRLVKLMAASVALSVSGAAVAGGYVVNLEPGSAGMVRGHAGLHAVDDKTETALVRIVSPGLEIRERGTIRVLVMNLGTEPFEFGPADVSITLADGSELEKVPLTEFEQGYSLITREQKRAAAVNMQTRNTLSTLVGQTGGSTSPSEGTDINSISRTDETALPGGKMLDAIYEVLMPETVAPQAASGGYLVFDLPKGLKTETSDVPLTITVRTGNDEHRFAGLLKWRR